MPWLYRSHPGYFYVALAVALTHIALGFDSFQPGRHAAPVFEYVRPPIIYYGHMHFVVGGVILACFYLHRRHWWLARAMFFISVLTFNTFSVGAILSCILDPTASWVAPTGLIAMSISSAAAWKEPIVLAPKPVPYDFAADK